MVLPSLGGVQQVAEMQWVVVTVRRGCHWYNPHHRSHIGAVLRRYLSTVSFHASTAARVTVGQR